MAEAFWTKAPSRERVLFFGVYRPQPTFPKMSQLSNKILVVDDAPTFRQGFRASLKSSGYEVDAARNAEEAVEYVRQHPVGIVLLDINMPGLGGLEACRRIRAAAPHAGVVMLSVRDAEDDKVAALEMGADDYLTKPFCLRELLGACPRNPRDR